MLDRVVWLLADIVDEWRLESRGDLKVLKLCLWSFADWN